MTTRMMIGDSSLRGVPQFEAMLDKVFDPRLHAKIREYWNLAFPKPRGWWRKLTASQQLLLEDYLQIFEEDQLVIDGWGTLQGEVDINIPPLERFHMEFFYAATSNASPTVSFGNLALTYVLNGYRTTNFDQLLTYMDMDYPRERGFRGFRF